MDATSCLGERSKAALSGVTVSSGSVAGIAASIERGNAADTVQRGCMADRGYVQVLEEQAEEKHAQLLAVAEARRQQEAAAQPASVVAAKRTAARTTSGSSSR
jgi:hypothetical protein